MHLGTGMTHSCHHPPTHKIPLEELKANPAALHNSKFKKEQRAMMLKGEKPAGCATCWKVEAQGKQLSDRAYRSSEPWAQAGWNDVLENGAFGDIMYILVT